MINVPDRIVITDADKLSAAWNRMQAYWAQQLADLRAMNDADLDIVATANLRGRIKQVKAFLSMDQEMPKVTQYGEDGSFKAD